MERLLLENFSLINKIKGEYDHLLEENKSLKGKIRELEGKKISLGTFSIADKTSLDEIHIDLNFIIKFAF